MQVATVESLLSNLVAAQKGQVPPSKNSSPLKTRFSLPTQKSRNSVIATSPNSCNQAHGHQTLLPSLLMSHKNNQHQISRPRSRSQWMKSCSECFSHHLDLSLLPILFLPWLLPPCQVRVPCASYHMTANEFMLASFAKKWIYVGCYKPSTPITIHMSNASP